MADKDPDEQAIDKILQFDLGANMPDESKWEEEDFPPPETQAARRFVSWRFPASANSPSPEPVTSPPPKPVSRFTLDSGRVKVIDFAYEQTLPPVPTVPLPLPSPKLLRAPSFKRRREVSPGNPNATRGETVKKSRPSQSEPIIVEHLGSSRRKVGPGHGRRPPKGSLARRSSTSRSGGVGKGGSRDRLSNFSLAATPMTPTSILIKEPSSPDTEPDDEPMTPVTSTSIYLLSLLVSPKESREEEELATHQFFGQQAHSNSGLEFIIPGTVTGISIDDRDTPSPRDAMEQDPSCGGDVSFTFQSEMPVFLAPM